jgi:recombination protein RecA
VIGSRTRAKVVKNKVAAPFREAEFDIIYGEGVSREGDLIDTGVTAGLLEKSGTWISYKADRLGQGRDNARVFLKENVDIRHKLEQELRKQLGLPNNHVAAAENGKPHAEAAKPNGDAHKIAPEVAKTAAKAAAAGTSRSSR